MYTKLILALMIAVLIPQFAVPTVLAGGEPIGRCPEGFTIEMAMDHDMHHHHQHVGTSADQNGDGYICMKHVTPEEGIHVHVDNSLP